MEGRGKPWCGLFQLYIQKEATTHKGRELSACTCLCLEKRWAPRCFSFGQPEPASHHCRGPIFPTCLWCSTPSGFVHQSLCPLPAVSSHGLLRKPRQECSWACAERHSLSLSRQACADGLQVRVGRGFYGGRDPACLDHPPHGGRGSFRAPRALPRPGAPLPGDPAEPRARRAVEPPPPSMVMAEAAQGERRRRRARAPQRAGRARDAAAAPARRSPRPKG